MTGQSRFIKSILKTAETTPPPMPWTRGARRDAFVAKRKVQELSRKTA